MGQGRRLSRPCPAEALRLKLRGAALCSDAHLARHEGRWRIEGDPTEGALVVTVAKAGLDKARPEVSLSEGLPLRDSCGMALMGPRVVAGHGLAEVLALVLAAVCWYRTVIGAALPEHDVYDPHRCGQDEVVSLDMLPFGHI